MDGSDIKERLEALAHSDPSMPAFILKRARLKGINLVNHQGPNRFALSLPIGAEQNLQSSPIG